LNKKLPETCRLDGKEFHCILITINNICWPGYEGFSWGLSKKLKKTFLILSIYVKNNFF
jgi:hypothetical protein